MKIILTLFLSLLPVLLFPQGQFMSMAAAQGQAAPDPTVPPAPDAPVVPAAPATDEEFTQAQQLLERKLKDATQPEVRTSLQNGLADLHSNWALVLQKESQFAEAIQQFQAAYELDKNNRRPNAGNDLQNKGTCYESLSRYSEAIGCYQQALPIYKETNDSVGEGQSLAGLGEAYRSLSRFDKSVAYAQQALPLLIAAKDTPGQCLALSVLGASYTSLKRFQDAIAAYQRVLVLQKALNDRAGEGQTLYSLGATYFNLGSFDKSVKYSQQALPFLREAKDIGSEGETLNNLGAAYQVLGQMDEARNYYQQGLGLSREAGDLQGQSLVLSNLMVICQLSNPRLAVFYGKQAVNVYQTVRAGIATLDKETQKSYLHSVEQNYRRLADLLIQAGRLPEAQQVLDMLKEEEYLDFIHRDGVELANTAAHADLTPKEADWQTRYQQIADRVTALGVERGGLLAKDSRTPEEDQRLNALEADLSVANQAFQAFLDKLSTEAGSSVTADKIEVLKEAQGLQDDLRAMGPGTVALYTLVGEKQYRVVMYTADTQKTAEYPISAADLSRKVLQFRATLQNPKSDPRPLAQELYQILIAPIATDLKGAQAKTLMWSLDGALRYLPMAALYDGQHYFVEDYRNVLFTPCSTAHLKDDPASNWKGLGLGVSKSQPGFVALPAVPGELHSIISDTTDPAGILPGEVKLDESFTVDAMTTALRQHYQMVHIASHFAFHPGSASDSYLLLGDGTHLTLDQIKDMPRVFSGVDLLTLSACNTAVGDIGTEGSGAGGKEVECFGVLAQRQGAKAVLASLWPVADDSTKQLMDKFYRLREAKTGTSKAEALRQAQLALLHRVVKPSDPAVLLLDPKASYTHPYFWAPFILIGNWK